MLPLARMVFAHLVCRGGVLARKELCELWMKGPGFLFAKPQARVGAVRRKGEVLCVGFGW